MSDKIWYTLARTILKAGGPPIPINENLIDLLKLLINEEQANFLLKFRKPLNFDQIKSKTNLEDKILNEKLTALMDAGLMTGIPSRTTGIMVYRLVGYLPGLLEFTLMKGESGPKQKRIAHLWKNIFNDSAEMTQKNYDVVMEAYKNAPPIDRVIPIETLIETHEELVLPEEDVKKLVEKFDIIGKSYCYCRHRKDLLDDPCKLDAPRENCLSFGRSAKFAIDHKFAKQISKQEALSLLEEAENLGLIHKTFHIRGDPDLEEMAICNCCKCCCGNLQGFYSGTSPTHTYTSYIAEIDEDICIGCGTCVEKCPIEAPFLEESIAQIDKSRCFGCGICVQGCPEVAIKLVRTGLREVFILAPKIGNSN